MLRDRWYLERQGDHRFVLLRILWFILKDLIRTIPAEHRRAWLERRRNHGLAPFYLLRSLWQDVRVAARTLSRSPGFTTTAALILALAIGANSAIFTVVKDLLVRPLPFAGADRIIYLGQQNKEMGFSISPRPAVIERWRDQAESFDVLEVYSSDLRALVGGPEPVMVGVTAVSPTFMSSFGIKPVTGRIFFPDDGVFGTEPVAILSQRIWQQNFGSDPQVIGRRITLGDSVYTVVGVVPSGFRLVYQAGSDDGVWIPRSVRPGEHDQVGGSVIARLKPGVSAGQALAELEVIGVGGDEKNQEWAPIIISSRGFLGARFVTGLWVLFGVVGVVLLIACSNVANMNLARGLGRTQELGVRVALGASRGRLVRLLLVESLLLCTIGGTVGLVMARWSVDLIAGLRLEDIPQLRNIALDGGVVVFTLFVTVGSTLLFGLLPAVHLSGSKGKANLGMQVRLGRAASRSRGLRAGLVVTETALALTLFVGAGLMVKSFRNLAGVDPGLDLRNLGMINLKLPKARYSSGEQQQAFFAGLLEEIRSLPGVEHVVVADAVPPKLSFVLSTPEIEGSDLTHDSPPEMISNVGVMPGYFMTVRTRLLRGRAFGQDDANSGQSIIINDAFARRYWPNQDAVGKRVRFRSGPWRTVVGVAQNVKVLGLFDDPDRLQTYYAKANLESPFATFIIRGRTPFGSLVPLIKDRVWALDSDLPVTAASVSKMYTETIGTTTFVTSLFAAFAVLAMVLAAAGVYGMISLTVNQRIPELGVRMALGASTNRVMRAVAVEALRPVAAGIALGVLVSVGLTRILESQLFHVSPTDPGTFLVVSLLLVVVASIASYIPTRRVLRIDPVVVLREQ